MLSRRTLLTSLAGTGATAALGSLLPTAAHADATLRSRIVQNANLQFGKTIGRGECTDFVDYVLKASGAAPGQNYVWGDPVASVGLAAPGMIIQFWDVHFTSPDGATWGTAPGGHHTAIVTGFLVVRAPGSVSTYNLNLIHQNDGQRSVTRRSLNMLSSHTGKMNVYDPRPA